MHIKILFGLCLKNKKILMYEYLFHPTVHINSDPQTDLFRSIITHQCG